MVSDPDPVTVRWLRRLVRASPGFWDGSDLPWASEGLGALVVVDRRSPERDDFTSAYDVLQDLVYVLLFTAGVIGLVGLSLPSTGHWPLVKAVTDAVFMGCVATALVVAIARLLVTWPRSTGPLSAQRLAWRCLRMAIPVGVAAAISFAAVFH